MFNGGKKLFHGLIPILFDAFFNPKFKMADGNRKQFQFRIRCSCVNDVSLDCYVLFMAAEINTVFSVKIQDGA